MATRIVTISYTEEEYKNLIALDRNTNDILFKQLENDLRRQLKGLPIKNIKRGLEQSNLGKVVLKLTAEY